jgi:hypothetical protein
MFDQSLCLFFRLFGVAAKVLKAEVERTVPDAKVAILAPPKEVAKARFFPDAVFEEDREYLLGALQREGAADMQVPRRQSFVDGRATAQVLFVSVLFWGPFVFNFLPPFFLFCHERVSYPPPLPFPRRTSTRARSARPTAASTLATGLRPEAARGAGSSGAASSGPCTSPCRYSPSSPGTAHAISLFHVPRLLPPYNFCLWARVLWSELI